MRSLQPLVTCTEPRKKKLRKAPSLFLGAATCPNLHCVLVLTAKGPASFVAKTLAQMTSFPATRSFLVDSIFRGNLLGNQETRKQPTESTIDYQQLTNSKLSGNPAPSPTNASTPPPPPTHPRAVTHAERGAQRHRVDGAAHGGAGLKP